MTPGHDHTHEHTHDPLEAIDHVHGGAMVVDIGGTVGALHVVLDEGWVGRELFLGNDDPAFSVHAGVWLRHAGDRHVASALFPALDEGAYRILGRGGVELRRVVVRGGEVTEADLAGAEHAGVP